MQADKGTYKFQLMSTLAERIKAARNHAKLTQKALAELFGVGVPAVNKHLKNIFASGELEPGETISKMEKKKTANSSSYILYVPYKTLNTQCNSVNLRCH